MTQSARLTCVFHAKLRAEAETPQRVELIGPGALGPMRICLDRQGPQRLTELGKSPEKPLK